MKLFGDKTEWVEKIVTTEEGNRLVNSNQAKFVEVLADNKMLVKVKAPIHKIIEEVKIEKVPGRIRYEIQEQKDLRTIIMKEGKVNKKKLYLDWKKRRFYPNHILKETMGKKVRYLVRWNMYFSEALDIAHQKIPEYDATVESGLANDQVGQLSKAMGQLTGLVIERTMIVVLLMAMVFGIPIGLSYNDIFHWVPNTVVHWVPRR